MAGKWLVIDAHTHFLPQEVVAIAVRNGFDLSAVRQDERGIPIKRTQDIEGLLYIGWRCEI